jgi:hypothetical protein
MDVVANKKLASILFIGSGFLLNAADEQMIRPKTACAALKDTKIAAAQIGLKTNGAVIAGATLTSATDATADRPWTAMPEYCDITGSILPVDPKAPNINFRVIVPTAWNRKAWHMGGGGINGTVTSSPTSRVGAVPQNTPSLVAQGFAVYGSDSGHQASMGGRGGPAMMPPQGAGGRGTAVPAPTPAGGRGPGMAPPAQAGRGPAMAPPAPSGPNPADDWIVNQESWMNFAYEQLKKTHDVAFRIMETLYSEKPKYSYWAGGSQGGREGLEVVSRYPSDYDGVFVTVPLAYFAALMIDPTVKGVTQVAPGAWVPPSKAEAIRNETLRLCDALDGIEDGVISNYRACNDKLDPSVTPNPLAKIRCPEGKDTGNTCLSDAQMATVNSLHAPVKFGYKLANGETDWPGWGTGMEAGAGFGGGWLLSNTQPDAANPAGFNAGIGATTQRGRLAFTQDFNLLTLDLAKYQKQIQAMSDELDVREDWSGFLKRGGKLIMVTGASDYISNPRAQMRLYEKVAAKNGQAAVDKSVRYYVVPNAGHGASGSDAKGQALPSTWNPQTALQNWVENGTTPPDAVVLTYPPAGGGFGGMGGRNAAPAGPPPTGSRIMCRYPAYPKYKGSGDPNTSESYTCAKP